MSVLILSCSVMMSCSVICMVLKKLCAAACFDQETVQLQRHLVRPLVNSALLEWYTGGGARDLRGLFLLQERRARSGVRRKQAWERALPEDPSAEAGEPAEMPGGPQCAYVTCSLDRQLL